MIQVAGQVVSATARLRRYLTVTAPCRGHQAAFRFVPFEPIECNASGAAFAAESTRLAMTVHIRRDVPVESDGPMLRRNLEECTTGASFSQRESDNPDPNALE